MQQPGLREVLDVERHSEHHVPELAVEPRKIAQLCEVEVDVLPVALSANVLVEQLAVGDYPEELALVGQIGGCLFLVAEVERHALRFEVD